MFVVHTELPNGATSRGYQFDSEEKARECFDRVRLQLVAMDFSGELIIKDGRVDLVREALGASR